MPTIAEPKRPSPTSFVTTQPAVAQFDTTAWRIVARRVRVEVYQGRGALWLRDGVAWLTNRAIENVHRLSSPCVHWPVASSRPATPFLRSQATRRACTQPRRQPVEGSARPAESLRLGTVASSSVPRMRRSNMASTVQLLPFRDDDRRSARMKLRRLGPFVASILFAPMATAQMTTPGVLQGAEGVPA